MEAKFIKQEPENTNSVIIKHEPSLEFVLILPNKSVGNNHIKKEETKSETTEIEENHKCQICHKSFGDASKLYQHNRAHKPKSECKICGESFRKDYVKIHMKRHGKKNFNCRKCDKAFHSKVDLKKHRKMHLKLFSCETCGKNFSSNNHLMNHKINHLGLKFTCFHCDKKFGGLIHHMDTNHREPREIKCKFCNFVALTRYVMAGHNRQHTAKHAK
jgi:KRAB domain-containing zinc finger protein